MSTAIAIQNQGQIFPTETEWRMLKEQVDIAIRSGFLPSSIQRAEQAIVIALKGRELGVPPLQAFTHIHVIQGKPTISSELMLSLIYKNCPGAVVNFIKSDATVCTIEVKRPGGKPTTFSFSMSEAQAAQLTSKDNWRKFPAAMLRARTISIAARAVFPDAIMGCSYIPEELGAEVDDEGQVIEIPQPAPAPVAPTPIQPVPQEPAAATIAKPLNTTVIRSRKTIGIEIMNCADSIGLSAAELDSWVFEEFKKEKKDLTIQELEKFLEMLQHEQGRR